MAYNIYQEFDIQNITVHLNSIGSAEIRPAYLDNLRKSVESIKNTLCNRIKEAILFNNSNRLSNIIINDWYWNRTHALFQDPEDSVTFTTQSTYQYNIRKLFLSIFNSYNF